MIGIGIFVLVIGLALLYWRYLEQAKVAQIKGVRTSTAQELKDGAVSTGKPVEVKGTIQCDSPLVAPLSGKQCVWYTCESRERIEVTTFETNQQTKQQERKTKTEHRVVRSDKSMVPFWIQDSTGRVMVRPEEADIDGITVVDRFDAAPASSIGQVLSTGSLAMGYVSSLPLLDANHRILGVEHKETIFPVNQSGYVLGELHSGGDVPNIAKRVKSDVTFVISTKSEEELVADAESRVFWLLIAGGIVSLSGIALIVKHFIH